MNLQYKTVLPLSVYQRLRASVGWEALPNQQAQNGLDSAFCTVCCMDEDTPAGMLRVMWDGSYSAFMCDVVVDTPYRHMGIASSMIELAKEKLYAAMQPGWKVRLFLLSVKEKESFYERCGFTVRPNDEVGAAVEQWLVK